MTRKQSSVLVMVVVVRLMKMLIVVVVMVAMAIGIQEACRCLDDSGGSGGCNRCGSGQHSCRLTQMTVRGRRRCRCRLNCLVSADRMTARRIQMTMMVAVVVMGVVIMVTVVVMIVVAIEPVRSTIRCTAAAATVQRIVIVGPQLQLPVFR